jgi:LysM repeat protein
MTGAAAISLSACGRSAPVDALNENASDPDIAGVSVTSPDAVVSTVPTSAGETTTTTAAVPQQILYTVQPGDTLSGIAASYNVTVEDLAAYNGITDPNSLRPGAELAIPPQPIVVETPTPVDPAAPADPVTPVDPVTPEDPAVPTETITPGDSAVGG